MEQKEEFVGETNDLGATPIGIYYFTILRDESSAQGDLQLGKTDALRKLFTPFSSLPICLETRAAEGEAVSSLGFSI